MIMALANNLKSDADSNNTDFIVSRDVLTGTADSDAVLNLKSTLETVANTLLNTTLAEIRAGSVTGAILNLSSELSEMKRQTSSKDDWRTLVTFLRRHPLAAVLREDPYTKRALEKPRGYAGDAVMIDYLYGYPPPTEISPLGRKIFAATVNSSCGQTVAQRRHYLAQAVKLAASDGGGKRVLSVAGGHVREAQLIECYDSLQLKDWISIDQDRESVNHVNSQYARLGITALNKSVRDLLTGSDELGLFDFIYAAGIYDYLPAQMAGQLTKALYGMLRPMGRLLIGNFSTKSADQGYMEAFMDWWLVYRQNDDMNQLAHSLPGEAKKSVYPDSSGNLLWLDVVRGCL
jgi:hypothetical protein